MKVSFTCLEARYQRNEIKVELIHSWHGCLHSYSLYFCTDVAWSPQSHFLGYFGIPHDESNLPHDMKWGFLMSGWCFYFDYKEEEQELKIKKKEKLIRKTSWCSWQRGRGEEDGYGTIKEKVALWMFQDLFFYSSFFYSSSFTVESWLLLSEYISLLLTQQTAL